MDMPDIIYTPKYHPDTARILHDALSSMASLLVLTLLTIGAVWFTSQTTYTTPTVLGTESVSP